MADDMADASAAGSTVNLKVLSPSSEIEGGLHLPQLPASTTVRELRLRIQDAVPSKPGPERMRLIYRGKVVANDADSLETVFGAENLRESQDQSLHLVLRELPQPATSTAARAATLPPNPYRTPPAPAGPPLQTNPFRAVPQPHHHHHAHPHVHHHHHVQPPRTPLGPLGAMPLPPQVQQQIAQALARAPGTPGAPGIPGTPATAPPADGAPQPAPADGAPPPPNGRAVRHEGTGPNGARWSVTIEDVTANIPLRPGQPGLPRPVPFPQAFAVPPRAFGSPAPGGVSVPLTWLLPRLRGTLQEAAREVDNVRTLLAPSAIEEAALASNMAAFPSWRAERIREHLRTITYSLNMVESGLSDPAMQLNMDVIALRQATGEVRRQANEFSRALDAREAGAATSSDPLIATAAAATRTLPADAPQELFLLSSPQGPVGVLFDQQGTYTTAPFASTLSSQAFIDQYNQNRQLIASLGQQIAHSSQNLHNQLGGLTPTPTQPVQPQPAQPEGLDPAAAQRVIQNIIQNRNERAENAAANPAAAENDRVGNVAAHLWLIFKLAVFVYIFAGGSGWYRPLMLSSIALVVYVAQLGVFERHFALARRYFEGLLPNAGAEAPEAPGAPEPRRNANVNLTPEEAARRLLQQQRPDVMGWAREGVRGVERGVALFVASLWPGIGERMVFAQEERERLARVAASEEAERREEERRRAEEEKQGDAKQEEGEAKQDDGASEQAASQQPTGEKPVLHRNATQTLSRDFMDAALPGENADTATGPGAKGKERAPDAEGEASASASASS
ncbi:hypothetical protein C7974DRAFT_27035 [Boeremia exigua]|uniref:uncharacterized protein n=1 Tax=Boeremia exigua TaxID=749465 RepID=UPI001E8E9BE2|nr:uncharacterized protein C7974DRAFT_27035 [Boeremia exigua]KAH6644742.1 hypothetical protein C7974DRAFT_27035 [Boeremia exigua]